ncbi:hypothetical protein [Paraburkholderia sp. J63]|uniref:hypothetical protein n=1 Tax=Paraburkholderia sp. J63 TaxID=2805434 RepID=UPI002ABE1F91|nr:hypothetical protein [Paraburkholderia sp. J63]
MINLICFGDTADQGWKVILVLVLLASKQRHFVIAHSSNELRERSTQSRLIALGR